MSAERTAIDDATIADIKSRVRLSEFIGRTAKLKRVGGEFVGLSPFKDERTPSFTVNDDKGFYHCFSSGKHGDIIEWVTETQGLNFRQAIDLLASETGTSVASTPAPTKVKSAPLVQICHYEYQDETGFPYMRVTRFEPKTFRQFHWDCDGWANGKPKTGVIPYRLPEIVARQNDDIWLVEGEKDADTLAALGLLATTAPGGATAFPRDDLGFLKWFDGRRVYAIPDNDEAGTKWRERVAHGIADVKFLHLGGPKDVTDYIEAGHDIADLVRLQDVDFDALDAFEPVAPSTPAAQEPDQPKPRRFKLSKLPRLEPDKIKPREWLLNNHLIRKFVSLTVSPGGLGKSSMTMIEGLSMAANRPLFDGTVIHEKRKMNVVMWNGEDPQDENMRRLYAAMKHYGVTYEEIEDTMIVESGREKQIKFANMVRGESELDEAFFVELEDELIENNTDVFVIDPFIQTHSVSENDNGAIDLVIKRLGRLADRANCAVEVVHHVRKAGTTGKAEPSMDDARGASALKDGIRSGRFLSKMPSDMAGPAGLSPEDAEVTFAVTGGKGNMARITGKSVWRKMISVPLGNSDEHGRTDDVGVCVAFDMPESALPSVDMSRAQDIALAILARDDTVRYHSGRGAAPHQWLGYLMADELGVDTSTETGKVALGRIRSLIRSMINDEAIHVRRASDGKHMVDYLAAGPREDDADKPPPHWEDDAPF